MTHGRRALALFAAAVMALALATPPAIAHAAGVVAQPCPTVNVPKSLAHRPVVLVHGWNSSAGAWDKTIGALYDKPYSESHRFSLLTFDYSANSNDWPTVPQIYECLAQELVEASRAYAAGGGDGKVLAVGHSMGGIAIRFASVQSFQGTKVADVLGGVVTLGTPHQGTPFGGTWTGAALQTLVALWDGHDLPPAGSSAEVCLADQIRRPSSCTAPPYLPPGIPLTTVGTQIYVQRDLFGVGLGPRYTVPIFGDGIVPQWSSDGYPASGPIVDGSQTQAPRTALTALTVDCTYNTSVLGLTPAAMAVLDRIGVLNLDSHAMDDLLAGSGATGLVGVTLDAAQTPCFHTHLTSYSPVLDYLAQALNADDKQLTGNDSTTITFTVSGCEGCSITAWRALSGTSVRQWDPVVVRSGSATLTVPSLLTSDMAFEMDPTDPYLGLSNARSVVVLRYTGFPVGGMVSTAQSEAAATGSWCWAGSHAAAVTIGIRVNVFPDPSPFGSRSIAEWASPAVATNTVGMRTQHTYHGGLGHQDAPYCYTSY